MLRVSFLKSAGLSLAAALVFATAPLAGAQIADSVATVKTVPAVNAKPIITAKVDGSKLSPLPTFVVPQGTKDLGAASPDMKMSLQLLLRRSAQQEAAVKLLQQQVLSPASSMYGKVFTPAEFAQTFGLAASDLATLKSALEEAGFTVGNVDNGRLAIDFEGTASQVNAALHTEIHDYVSADGTRHYAPAAELQIPKALAPAIERINGLQNFTIESRPGFNGPVADFTVAGEKLAAAASGKAPTPVLTGEGLHDASFTASKYVLGLRGSTTLNVRIGGNNHPATGSVAIEDQNGKVVSTITDITRCEPYGSYGRSCTADYSPAGVGAVYLKAIYSGDEFERGTVLPLTIISLAGTSTSNVTVTPSNFDLYSTTPSETLTITIAYVGNGTNPTATAPTGTITVIYYGSTGNTWATLTLGTTSGGGTSTNLNPYTYSCPAANTVTQTVTCTVTMANAAADATTQAVYGGFDYQATYSGDTSNYATSVGYGIAYLQHRAGTATPTTHTASGNATATYGTAFSDNNVEALSGAGGSANSLCGNATYPSIIAYYATSGTGAVATPSEIGGGVFFQMYNGGTYCTNTSTYSDTITVTGNTWLAPGVYPFLAYYSGNTAVATATTYLVSGVALTSTSTLTISEYTPTLSAVTSTPATVGVGTSTPVVLSDTFTVPTIGVLPSGAVTFTLNSVAYTATCVYTATAGSLTCSATVPGATIAALAGGTYTITSAFAGDNFYSAVTTGGTGTLSVKAATTATMTSPTSASPVSQVYGALGAFTVTGQLAWSGGTVPTKADVTFTSTAAGTFGTVTCTGTTSPYTCSATFTPTSTDAVGSYNINLNFSGDTNYASSVSTQVGNYIITGAARTLALTPNPVISAYGSVTGITITATTTGTGTVTFSGAYATYGTLSATTCTLAAGACTVTFTPNGTTAVGTGYAFLSASVAANGNYLASNTATDTLNITAATPTVTFTPSPITSAYQSTAGITVTVSTSPADTGTVTFSGSYATYGTLSSTTCVLSSGSCSVTFTPNGTTAIGTYSNILTATVPANANLNQATASDSLTISALATYLAISPVNTGTTTNGTIWTATGAPDTLTVVLSWTATTGQPTGNIVLTEGTSSAALGYITLPSSGSATSSGTDSATGKPASGTATYSCTGSVVYDIITCTLANPSMTSNFTNTAAGSGDEQTGNGNTTITATLAASGNFATATATTYVYFNNYESSGTTTPTITPTPSALTATTYGQTTNESVSVVVANSTYQEFNLAGEFLSVIGTSSGADTQLGTLYETPDAACTTDSCTIAATLQVQPVVSPGSYTITYIYTGDYQYNAGDLNAATATGTLTVNKQTPTLGTVTFSPASSEPYGTSQAITISDVLSWTGAGIAPTGAVKYVLNSVTYTATCTALTTTSENCSAVVPAATIAALTPNSYTVTAAYATDNNYAACTGTSATFTITAATSTLTLSAATAGTTTTGTTSSLVTVTLSPAVSGVAVQVTDSTTTNGVYVGATNASGVATFTLTTSTSGVAAGLNNLVATSGATSYVTAATSNTVPVYLQGLLLASSLNHNFTSFTAGESGVDGTYDGSPICNGSNGVNGQTCTTGYSVAVTNFTTSSQVITATLGTLADNAFSYATNCPANGLAAGAKCQFVFYYLPPYGDGCNPSTNCTTFVSGGTTYKQGTFEETTWKITSGSLLEGLYFSGTTGGGQLTVSPAMLEGKAVLASGNYLTVTPSSMTFGPQAPNTVSATQNITVTNTSSAAVSGIAYTLPGGTFTTNNQCGATLAAGATCQIQVSYSGTTVKTNTGTVTITPPSPETALSVSLSGTTVATGETLSLTTTTHNFGNVTTGTTVTFGLGITNNSTDTAATLSFVAPASNGFTFNTSGCPNPLPVSSSCQIQVSFTPTSVTSYSQNLTISSNLEILPGGTTTGPTYTNTVAFTGSGVAGGQLAATSTGHNFGNTAVGSEATAYGVVLTNNTAVALTLSLGPLSNTTEGYTYATNCPATLAVNSNCNLVFYYTPNAVGLTQVMFPVTATNGGTTYQMNGSVAAIALSGTGQ